MESGDISVQRVSIHASGNFIPGSVLIDVGVNPNCIAWGAGWAQITRFLFVAEFTEQSAVEGSVRTRFARAVDLGIDSMNRALCTIPKSISRGETDNFCLCFRVSARIR